MEWNISQVGKPIPASHITKVKNGTVLVDILNKAAGDNKQGPFNNYDSIYYGGLGYHITAMNGVKEDLAKNTHWMMFDQQTGVPIPCGVNSYVPVDGSTTIFRFTKYSASSPNDSVSGYCKLAPSSGQVCHRLRVVSNFGDSGEIHERARAKMGSHEETRHERGGRKSVIREIKISVYGKQQALDSRYPSAVIYGTFFCLSSK